MNIDWTQMVTAEMKAAAVYKSAVAEAEQRMAKERMEASSYIDSYTDMVDMGEATSEDEAMLASWRTFRVNLLKVTKQPGYPLQIDWPVKPA